MFWLLPGRNLAAGRDVLPLAVIGTGQEVRMGGENRRQASRQVAAATASF